MLTIISVPSSISAISFIVHRREIFFTSHAHPTYINVNKKQAFRHNAKQTLLNKPGDFSYFLRLKILNFPQHDTALRVLFLEPIESRPANKIFHDTARVTALVVEHVPRSFHSDLQTPRWQTYHPPRGHERERPPG